LVVIDLMIGELTHAVNQILNPCAASYLTYRSEISETQFQKLKGQKSEHAFQLELT